MITVRLDPSLEKHIADVAKARGVTKSELIRESVSEYLAKLQKPSAWELGIDRFGRYSSGKRNLSSDRKIILKSRLGARRS